MHTTPNYTVPYVVGNTEDMTLSTEVWVNQPRSCEHGNAGPIICQGVTWQERDLALHQYLGQSEELSPFLSCGGTGRKRLPALDSGGRADPEVIRELSLLCICCSSGKSDQYSLSGQNSRADFEGVSVGESTLRM